MFHQWLKIGQLISEHAVTLKLTSETKGGFQSCGDVSSHGVCFGRERQGNGLMCTAVMSLRAVGVGGQGSRPWKGGSSWRL
jgi:hypothetical protein